MHFISQEIRCKELASGLSRVELSSGMGATPKIEWLPQKAPKLSFKCGQGSREIPTSLQAGYRASFMQPQDIDEMIYSILWLKVSLHGSKDRKGAALCRARPTYLQEVQHISGVIAHVQYHVRTLARHPGRIGPFMLGKEVRGGGAEGRKGWVRK